MVMTNLPAEWQWRHRQRTNLWTQQGEESMGRIERVALKHIHHHM